MEKGPPEYLLSSVFDVSARFQRSVNIERDHVEPSAFKDYILTPSILSTLERLSRSLSLRSTSRAWTITGPYGSGKSAMALYLAELWGGRTTKSTKFARRMLRENDPKIARKLIVSKELRENGLHPVLIVGSLKPIKEALLGGMSRSLKQLQNNNKTYRGKLGRLINRVDTLIQDGNTKSSAVVELYEETSNLLVNNLSPFAGLLVVIDELGKFLEFAAQNPSRDDIYVLQELAEAASRSGSNRLIILTVLHQAFEQYAKNLSIQSRQEWSKVQGRFEDIAYQEPSDGLLRLLSSAIKPLDNGDLLASNKTESIVQKGEEIGLVRGSKKVAHDLLMQCLPLHPTTATLLGPLFRSRLAQNERSLFSFMSSQEPYGFKQFLQQTKWNEAAPIPLYRLDGLYDYVTHNLGSRLYVDEMGKRWLQIDECLYRLPANASPLEARLIKAIGLLGILGDQQNIRASKDFLIYSFMEEEITSDDIENALEELSDQSITCYRRYKDAYALWEGSDVDLDVLLKKELSRSDATRSLSARLRNLFPIRPAVARRHVLETGTLRYFDKSYSGAETLKEDLKEGLDEADGRIVYVFPGYSEEREKIIRSAKELTKASGSLGPEAKTRIVVVTTPTDDLHHLTDELEAWGHIAKNSHELEGDNVAKRELAFRQSAAEQRLAERLNNLMAFDSSDEGHRPEVVWDGQSQSCDSEKEFNRLLSTVCESAYSSSPRIYNELINRRALSSSAARARRDLLEAMLTYPDEFRHGIQGTPAEVSIYDSLFSASKLHREKSGKYAYGPPPQSDPNNFRPLWAEIDQFLAETEVSKSTVDELFNRLRRPPFGVKDGALPLLLGAALLYYDTDVAVYERGSFVPKLTISVFERLMKSPSNFQLQRFRIRGVRAKVFKSFAQALSTDYRLGDKERLNMLDVVTPLCRFAADLPPYTRQTSNLSSTAQAMREVLLTAREPGPLLFSDIPQALEFDPIRQGTRLKPDILQSLEDRLRQTLIELGRTYDDLLGNIERKICDAFQLRETGSAARKEFRERSKWLVDSTVNLELKAFLLRATDETLDFPQWIESLAACLAHKPPRTWTELDIARFDSSLVEISGAFKRLNELAIEMGKLPKDQGGIEEQLVRIGLTYLGRPEQKELVNLSNAHSMEVQTLVDELLDEKFSPMDKEAALCAVVRILEELLKREE